MSLGPINNTSAFSQSYQVFYENGSLPQFNTEYLAPSTDSVIYQPGVILARYDSSGPYPNQLVNYKAGAANGQGNPLGVITDNNMLIVAAGTAPNQPIQYVYASVNLYYNALSGSVTGDVDAAITAWNGVMVYDTNGNQIVWKP